MHLLYRWVGANKGWKATTLEKEQTEIACFYDLEEAKKRLAGREILLCGVKLVRLYNGVL